MTNIRLVTPQPHEVAQLRRESREWLTYWLGSALGIIVIGTLYFNS